MDKVLNFLSLASAPSYTITGNYSYYLDVSIKGDSPYQTSTISLTAFTKSDKKIAIAVSCKWYRVLCDRQYRLATIHSNAYQLSAEDLGYTLKIEVTPQEEDQEGTAIVQYGPIRLDPNVRNTLENILGAGGSRFPIQLVDEDTGATSREPAALSLTSEYIRIVETPPVGKEKEVKFKYNYDIPKVELNYLDTNRLYFLFTGEEEDCEGVRKFLGIKKGVGCKLGIKLISRTARDLLILAIKCFATKSYMANSNLINEVVFCPGKIFKDKKDAPQQIGDTILEVDSMKREMYLVLLRNQELSKDKERLQVSVKRLEEELGSTIDTYSQLINEVRTNSDVSQVTENAGEYKKKAEDLEEEVKKLRRRVQEMQEDKILTEQAQAGERRSERPRRTVSNKDNDEIAKIGNDFQALAKKKEEQNLFSLEYELKLHDLEEENEKLRAKNDSLLDELKEAREMAGSRQSEVPRMSKARNVAVDESFFMIENKLSDTKRLNELLIKQVHDLKAKNATSTKEIDTLKAEILELRAGNNTEQQTKEKFYKQEKEALEKELQRLRQENSKLTKEKASSVPASERDRLEEQNTQFSKRIEALQRENNELKERYEQLERRQARNSVNMSQSGSVYSTPVRNRENLSEELTMRIKGELDSVRKDAVNWKSKCTNLEMELERLRRENNELKDKLGQMDTLNMSGMTSPANKRDYMGYLDKSMTNTSRTYEALLADAKRENDRLYAEVGTLKANLITTEFSLQMMTKDLERAKGSPREHELAQVRKEVESLREENERLRTEVGLLRVSINKQVSVEERDRILVERDRLRGEVESLNKEKASWAEFREKSNEIEWKLNEKVREIEMLKAELENYRTKNGSLVKEAEYLREELKRNQRKEQSILDMSMGVESEYKAKYEKLEEQYKKLEQDLDAMRNASFSRRNDDTEALQQMNELLRREVMEYKQKLEEQGRRSVRNVEVMNPVDEELRKRNKALEVEMQNQRGRIADLEKENERFRLMGSLRESTNDDSFSRSAKKGKEDVEKLKNENENLLLQRNQLSKKVESLVKELESKVGVKTNQAMLENLAKTNERLIQENARLMDELDAARYGSRLENSRLEDSRFEDNDKERMQQELMMVRAERDQLLVEVSKIKAVEKNKRIFG